MKLRFLIPVLSLAGCTTVEYVERPTGHQLVYAHDAAAMIELKEARPIYRSPCGYAQTCGVPPGARIDVPGPTATHSFRYSR